MKINYYGKNFNIILYVVLIMMASYYLSNYTEKQEQKQAQIVSASPSPTEVSTSEITPTFVLTEKVSATQKVERIRADFVLAGSDVIDMTAGSVDLLKKEDFAMHAKYFTKTDDENFNCSPNTCLTGVYFIKGTDAYTQSRFVYDENTNLLKYAAAEIFLEYGTHSASILDDLAADASHLIGRIFGHPDYYDTPDKARVKSLAMNFFSSYIPEHPKIPAICTYKLSGYYLTFAMGVDEFVTIISFDSPPEAYVIENTTD